MPKIALKDGSAPRSWRRRWWYIWWKCQPSLFSSSRTLSFQFPAVVVSWIMKFLKVFTQNRVQQHRILSSRTLIFQFPVEVFKVFSRTGFSFVDQLVAVVIKVYSQDSSTARRGGHQGFLSELVLELMVVVEVSSCPRTEFSSSCWSCSSW